MLKVFSSPTPQECKSGTNGIQQVILNLAASLPEFGYEFVPEKLNADLILNHAASGDSDPDVAYVHGLYPTYKLANRQFFNINAGVIHNARMAKEIIVPSEWVAQTFKRDMHISPNVINHGIDVKKWRNTQENQGYILWNKNRPDDVCTPEWIVKLAKANPNLQFVSTFGADLPNMRLTGAIAHAEMLNLVKGAAVYLATTRETGDLGSREALAAGIPVLGFAQGAILDFCVHGYNSYLATPGDFDSLNTGLQWVLRNRKQLSKNAIESAKGFSWKSTAYQVSQVFDKVLNPVTHKYKVSVIIPCYNYGHFITQALDSVVNQTFKDYEIIIVNDGSTDNSLEIIGNWLNKHPEIAAQFININNQGVAQARNIGASCSQSPYLCFLDADDMLMPDFLQVCVQALDKDHGLGIAYTRLKTTTGHFSEWLAGQFNFYLQTQGQNQIPTCNVMRKSAFERAGGYRTRYSPAEDADLWLRITTFGYKAQKVSDQPLFIYRYHENSLSAPYRSDNTNAPKPMPNWYADKGFLKNMPFAAPCDDISHAVRDYDMPDVAVIIPVSPKHIEHVKSAIDSVEQQTFWNWECIVVNNSGQSLDHLLKAYPFIQIVECDERSAAKARNAGLMATKAPLTVFLDADDYLFPEFLTKTIRAYKENGGSYIYTDWIRVQHGATEVYHTPPFDLQIAWSKGSFHAITALIPTKEAKQVKFDEQMPSFEDWDFFLGLIKLGICGKRIGEPLFAYNLDTGELREKGVAMQDELKPYIYQKYADYIEGIKQVACGCKAGTKKPDENELLDSVKVRYLGINPRSGEIMQGSMEIRGAVTKTFYGYRTPGDSFYVYKPDYLNAQPGQFEPILEVELEHEQQLVPADL